MSNRNGQNENKQSFHGFPPSVKRWTGSRSSVVKDTDVLGNDLLKALLITILQCGDDLVVLLDH